MEIRFTPAEEAFRAQARTWLAANVPRERPARTDLKARRTFDLAWQRKLFDAGSAGVSWPKEYGGRGASLMEQLVWFEEYARAGAPEITTTFVGLNHAGPTLIACGSEEQKAFHLPRILRGEVIWCQGFSEPNAGSDLASLQTRATIDGDHLVVNGQKNWTSYGNIAEFQELLVRTNPAEPRHRGITWVICPMDTPGIDIRPITTLTGDHDFCEVFYDNVRVPLKNVVGRIDDGWRVAMATLSFERGTAFLSEQVRLSRRIEELAGVARTVPGPQGQARAIDDDDIARRLARASAEVDAMRAMSYRSISLAARTGMPGAEASMIRLFFSELVQRIDVLAMDILGPAAVTAREGEPGARWATSYLTGLSQTIGGGTKDIQRNIIGDRVLGYHGERMDLTLGAEQESIRDAIREVLADRMPIARVRSVIADGARIDRALWQAAGELGWFALGVPEEQGGAGYGLSEEMLLFVELGRSLAPGPWLGSVLAAHALAAAPALRDTHRAVLAGTHGVAVIDDVGNGLGDARLSGTVVGVPDGGAVQGFLILGAQAVRYVAADAAGLRIDAGAGIDPTRPVAAARFDAVTAETIGRDAELLRQMATVLAAAEAVGVAERTLEASVEHGKVRQQFGRPIGSFQAVKHRCSDMAVRAEVARSVTIFAAVALRDREEGAARSARVAKALAVDAAIANASDNVQNHGGMGYTWEGDAHLYLKRAWLLEHVFGTRAVHLDALAAGWRAR